MGTSVTLADITPGTVLTFTRDLTFLEGRWSDRRPGIHYVVNGMTASGYMFDVLNTATGRRDALMAEYWVLESMRVVGRVPAELAPCDQCGCECDPAATV